MTVDFRLPWYYDCTVILESSVSFYFICFLYGLCPIKEEYIMKKYTKVLAVFLSAAALLYALAGCAAAPAATGAPASAAPAYQAPSYQAAATEAPAYAAAESQAAASQAPALCPPGQDYAYPQPYDTSSEEYGEFIENGFKSPAEEPLSTFSIDVDTASYSNIRRYLEDDMLPPADAVRVEECVNYFPYSYAPPKSGDPVKTGITISKCPWTRRATSWTSATSPCSSSTATSSGTASRDSKTANPRTRDTVVAAMTSSPRKPIESR
jgi:hypothetical protein